MAKGKSQAAQTDGFSFSVLAFAMSALSLISLKVILYDTLTVADLSLNPITALISVMHDLFSFDTILHVVALAAVVVSAICLSLAIQRGHRKNSIQLTLTFLATLYDIVFLLALITGQTANILKY